MVLYFGTPTTSIKESPITIALILLNAFSEDFSFSINPRLFEAFV